MKICWPNFLLLALLAGVLAPSIAETKDNDGVSQRAHRRAELRSALSAPLPSEKQPKENANATIFLEHQLSAQEREALRRQLREQFRSIGFDAAH
jgi:hypothetical protein